MTDPVPGRPDERVVSDPPESVPPTPTGEPPEPPAPGGPAGDAEQEPREGRWRGVILAALAAIVLPGMPPFSLLAPVQQTIRLLIVALAVLALLGWWAGGRLRLVLTWGVLAAWVAAVPVLRDGTADGLTRGWTVLVPVSFGLVSVLFPGRRFLPRALGASVLALLTVFVVLLVRGPSPERAMAAVRGELERRAASDVAQLEASFATGPFSEVRANNPEFEAALGEWTELLRGMPEWAAVVVPALAVLEGIAILALAWATYHRLARQRVGPPLSRLRDFRFNDQLVWAFAVGLAMVVLPALAEFRGVGANLLVASSALYALRGLGVLSWFLATRPVAKTFVVFMTVLAPYYTAAIAVGIGLGDTWMDWRHRVRPAP